MPRALPPLLLRREPHRSPTRDPAERGDLRSGSVPPGYGRLCVATWNIHSCVGMDARFAPERTACVIRGLDADVVGLQEVGWHHRGEMGVDQFAFLEAATGYRALAGPTKHNRAAHYGNALLTRRPVVEVVPLDLAMPMREPRGGLCAVLDVDGVEVQVIVAHLGLDPWERNAQVTRILSFLDARPPRPTVFMGDLNEWRPKAPRLARLSERLPDCAAPRSFHARLPTLRLDRIFVSPTLHLASFEVVRSAMTRRASDHLPVRALIGVPPRDAG
ncbi:endonuclease/exonuclease/phosphatase family protein [Rhodocista pekingensis]|uniref:Endonuclease/exonuclease/phosphatase family protein n=1 Tax=Rhodocista pekingensis TaxID=201185 RepID=A0ABW2L0R7_9PROT